MEGRVTTFIALVLFSNYFVWLALATTFPSRTEESQWQSDLHPASSNNIPLKALATFLTGFDQSRLLNLRPSHQRVHHLTRRGALSGKVSSGRTDLLQRIRGGSKKDAMVDSLGTLTYFPLLAKGLAPALCAEFSGLPWKSNKETGFSYEGWNELRESGKPPFGQLPILETEAGMVIGQCIAICNYIGHVSGLAGRDAEQFSMSQMLMVAAEDLYNLLQKYQPTVFVPMKQEDNEYFWTEVVPFQIAKLERAAQSFRFDPSVTTVGELYLFAILHQMILIEPNLLQDSPVLQKLYKRILDDPKASKVLAGESAIGQLSQYFVKASGEDSSD